MTNALQRATSSSAAVSARFGQWEAGWESPSYKKVRVMVIWQKVLADGTIVERSLTLQDLKVDLLLLLKQGSSVMNFLQWRPCPSIRSSFALLFITEHQKINSFPVHFPSPAPLISFPFVLQFQSVNEEDEWSMEEEASEVRTQRGPSLIIYD